MLCACQQQNCRLLCTARRKGKYRLCLLVKLFVAAGLPLRSLHQACDKLLQAEQTTAGWQEEA